MKKHIVLLPFLVVILHLVSCKNDKRAGAIENNTDDLVIEQEEVIDKLPNPSDINFIASLQEYQKGDYHKAAQFIQIGLKELQKESTNLSDADKAVLNESVTRINGLVENVKKGDQDIATLTQAFGNAEMLVAHDYFVYTVSTLLDEPAKGTYFFSKALRSLDNAVITLNGDAKNEAMAIQTESRALVNKVNDGSVNVEDDIKYQTQKIKDFLKKHKLEIF